MKKYFIFKYEHHIVIRKLIDYEYQLIYKNCTTSEFNISLEVANIRNKDFPSIYYFDDNIDKYLAKLL